MLNPIIIITLFTVLLTACNTQQSTPNTPSSNHSKTQMTKQHKGKPNQLIQESSPYLLQHAYNPVDWHPWNEEALQKAKATDKLLIISVGYAACHWCHVMEHESFEDTTVAQLMNDNFVSIKVDREERPDVDQIYMNAAYFTTGSGGWPLNAIALPDGRPIYGGTYFPKENWLQILEFFAHAYQNDRASLLEQAERFTKGIQSVEKIPLLSKEKAFTKNDLNDLWAKWRPLLDTKMGGRKTSSNKFPMPNNYMYLLQYQHLTKNKEAKQAVLTTLDKMAWGGIYDHLGGGFARYSTDPNWIAPHFEKMLYDNGQLVSLYAYAYQLTKNPLYKEVVYETLAFVQRELTAPEGGFYSSLDADSEGEEGKFYVWQQTDIEALLGEDALIFNNYFSVKKRGNWEHNNILYRQQTKEQVAKKHNISVEKLNKVIADGKTKLFKKRSKRIRPGLDDKILTAWNALMLKGYVDAYRVFNEPTFLAMALKNAQFLVQHMLQADNRLDRNYKNGKSTINGFLDDYSLTIEAFMALYQATFDEQWLYQAKDLMAYVQAHFSDEATKMFYYTSDMDAPLIARKMELSDNVIPASNSSIAKGLYLLGLYFYDKDYLAQAKQMAINMESNIKENPAFHSNWASLWYCLVQEPYEVAIVGESSIEKRSALDRYFLPNVVFLGGKIEGNLALLKNKKVDGQTLIYVCKNKTCQHPVQEVGKALSLIQ